MCTYQVNIFMIIYVIITIIVNISASLNNQFEPLLSRKLQSDSNYNDQSLSHLSVFKEIDDGLGCRSAWRAVARQHFGNSFQWHRVQRDLFEFYHNPRHADEMINSNNPDLVSIAEIYKREIHVYTKDYQDPQFLFGNNQLQHKKIIPSGEIVNPVPIRIVNWGNMHYDSIAPLDILQEGPEMQNYNMDELLPYKYPIFLRSYNNLITECIPYQNKVLFLENSKMPNTFNPRAMQFETNEYEVGTSYNFRTNTENDFTHFRGKIKIGEFCLLINDETGQVECINDCKKASLFEIYNDIKHIDGYSRTVLSEGNSIRIVNPDINNHNALQNNGYINNINFDESNRIFTDSWRHTSFIIDSIKDWDSNTYTPPIVPIQDTDEEVDEEEEEVVRYDPSINEALQLIAKARNGDMTYARSIFNEVFKGDVETVKETFGNDRDE